MLLVVIDTLSARHLDAYGYTRVTAPFLSEEAKKGVLFEDVMAAAPFTAPAMASIFTGLDSMHHGVAGHVADLKFSRANHTLAEAFHEAGYVTFAVVTNPWLTQERGYDQGFDRFDQRGTDPAGALGDLLLKRAAQVPAGRPWFAWLHILDVHMPYRPAPADRNHFQAGVADALPIRQFVSHELEADQIFFATHYPQDEIERTRTLYDSAIWSMDAVVRRTVEELRAGAGGPDLITIYTADHGEALCEHGLCWSHEFTLYQELLSIPWIVRAPGRLPEGVRVATTVRAIDEAPTVAELAQIPLAGTVDGVSALPLARGTVEPSLSPRISFAESAPYREKYKRNPRIFLPGDEGRWKSARDGRWKLIVVPKPGGDETELYDLAADPHETKNLAAKQPEEVARLRASIDAWVKTRRAAPADDSAPPVVTPAEAEQLRSLGYTAK